MVCFFLGGEGLLVGFFASSYYSASQRIKGNNLLGISWTSSVTQGALCLLISIKLLLTLSIKTVMSLQLFWGRYTSQWIDSLSVLSFKNGNHLHYPHAHKEVGMKQTVASNGKSHLRHEEKPQKAVIVTFGDDLQICWFISATTADVYAVWPRIIRTDTHLFHISSSGKVN